MAYTAIAHIVMAFVVMAYVAMAYAVMAYTVMAYVVMAHVVMATPPDPAGHHRGRTRTSIRVALHSPARISCTLIRTTRQTC